MRIRFTKMHGAGNDFVMIDAVRQRVHLDASQLRFLADRHRGVGADQVLLVEPSDTPGIDFRYRIFNADGNEVEQCGNGARCFVRFVREQGLTEKRKIKVQTRCGVIEPAEQDDGRITVEMGMPRFDPSSVGFDSAQLDVRTVGNLQQWLLAGEDEGNLQPAWLHIASIGNPHAVQFVDNLELAAVQQSGPKIERHTRFANGVNAGFAQVVDRQTIRLRVWERGVGETLACGTGACAAAVIAVHSGRVESPVQVIALGGQLSISWQSGQPIYMTGDANTVFEGEINV